jgi:hypothetical protein
MKHDDFCVTPSSDEPCSVCALISRVRHDERDSFDGGKEWNEDAAYQRGYEAGKSEAPVASVSTSGINLVDMRAYILERVPTLTESQISSLYDMYISFGGE